MKQPKLNKKQKQKLFQATQYDTVCEHCRYGKTAPDGNSVLCAVRGVMRRQSSCKKYEYDPIKRVPARSPALPEYDPELFTL